MTITDVRQSNLDLLRRRYPEHDVRFLDMESPTPVREMPFDIVYCYGLLYHLKNPEQALEFLSRSTGKILLLETCVSFGDSLDINLVPERQQQASQAFSGTGCRPTRQWLFSQLQLHFEHVYLPLTQPNHEEFPLDWSRPERHRAELARSVFVASHEPLENDLLGTVLPQTQVRHA